MGGSGSELRLGIPMRPRSAGRPENPSSAPGSGGQPSRRLSDAAPQPALPRYGSPLADGGFTGQWGFQKRGMRVPKRGFSLSCWLASVPELYLKFSAWGLQSFNASRGACERRVSDTWR